jgi:hypothetical protein
MQPEMFSMGREQAWMFSEEESAVAGSISREVDITEHL